MNKKFIVIGITLVFLIVGLSGCVEVGFGITNIGDIDANPENYLGEEVTVEGDCYTSSVNRHYGAGRDLGRTILLFRCNKSKSNLNHNIQKSVMKL